MVDFTLTGDYTLKVTGLGSQTPTYDFVFWNVDADVAIPVVLDRTIEDVRVPTQTMTYTIDATAGDDLVFAITRNENNASLFTLTSPSGAVLFQDRLSGSELPTLTETGTYTLTLQTSNAADLDLNGTFGFRFLEPFAPGATTGQVDSQGTEFWSGSLEHLTTARRVSLSSRCTFLARSIRRR